MRPGFSISLNFLPDSIKRSSLVREVTLRHLAKLEGAVLASPDSGLLAAYTLCTQWTGKGSLLGLLPRLRSSQAHPSTTLGLMGAFATWGLFLQECKDKEAWGTLASFLSEHFESLMNPLEELQERQRLWGVGAQRLYKLYVESLLRMDHIKGCRNNRAKLRRPGPETVHDPGRRGGHGPEAAGPGPSLGGHGGRTPASERASGRSERRPQSATPGLGSRAIALAESPGGHLGHGALAGAGPSPSCFVTRGFGAGHPGPGPPPWPHLAPADPHRQGTGRGHGAPPAPGPSPDPGTQRQPSPAPAAGNLLPGTPGAPGGPVGSFARGVHLGGTPDGSPPQRHLGRSPARGLRPWHGAGQQVHPRALGHPFEGRGPADLGSLLQASGSTL